MKTKESSNKNRRRQRQRSLYTCIVVLSYTYRWICYIQLKLEKWVFLPKKKVVSRISIEATQSYFFHILWHEFLIQVTCKLSRITAQIDETTRPITSLAIFTDFNDSIATCRLNFLTLVILCLFVLFILFVVHFCVIVVVVVPCTTVEHVVLSSHSRI